MKLLVDFLPIILFFISYKFVDIYFATLVIIVATLIHTVAIWILKRRLETANLVGLALLVIFGAATLFFRNELFIKWKPTAVYWVLALLLVGRQFFKKATFMEIVLKDKVSLSQKTWQRLTYSWVVFFLLMGVINLAVAYNFNTATWVNFKLFGALGATILFGIAQSVYISRQVITDQKNNVN